MNEQLPGDYIAGFVDGEGCFALKFRRDVRHDRPNKPTYFYWDIEFAIVLRSDDREILESIKATLACGRISLSRKGDVARYAVSKTEDLIDKVVPFFNNHRLRAKKRFDFDLWKEALDIFARNRKPGLINREPGKNGFQRKEWAAVDSKRLMEIHEEMKKYKSRRNEWKWLHETAS